MCYNRSQFINLLFKGKSMAGGQIELSVVIPMYREEEVVERLYEKLTGALIKLKRSYEIILVNDGSTDNTLEKLLALNKKDKRV